MPRFAGRHKLAELLWGRLLPHLSTLGKNALLVYLLHMTMIKAAKAGDLVQKDSGIIIAVAYFLCIYATCYLFTYFLEKKKWFLKI